MENKTVPHVSPDDFIPVLERKIELLSAFVRTHEKTLCNKDANGTLWRLVTEVVQQTRNVAGPPGDPPASYIVDAINFPVPETPSAHGTDPTWPGQNAGDD